MAHDDPRRQIAAVEACLYQRLDAKHTLTPQAMLWTAYAPRWERAAPRVARAAVDRALGEHAIIAAGAWLPACWRRRDGETLTQAISASCWLAFPDPNGICSQATLSPSLPNR